MASRKRIVLLGATGSIGESALRVIAAHSDALELVGIGARASTEKLATIARRFRVPHVALSDTAAADAARRDNIFPAGTALHAGLAGLTELATLPEADLVLVAIVGTTALQPTLAAIAAGKDIALASKEILVLAGKFVMAAARERGVRLLPVDSEHNALFQCLADAPTRTVRRMIVTASGGAFRDRSPADLAHVTPEDALRHPNWSMGPKITVDSATLANKGLEMIEAQWLFGLRAEQVEAVIHPQSIVHGLVEFTDGSILAQLTPPSMTFAIQHTLLFPERRQGVEPTLDFAKLFALEFRPVDDARYPCLRHACAAMRAGGAAPAVFNAANEVAVAAFLAHRLPFLGINRVVGETLARIPHVEPASLDEVLECDRQARATAEQLLRHA
ncbi:MAG TPA: 1-deoxy-D-xylulose-5-phosphate reductoisomerase [Opitutaceae bacterium]|nr:1-deoxy-D-xylulose-5-phosphate reductoisomerase [Opitutaceae bacterium]